ncbi:hypothetical protein LP421_30005 (plasmid) [Rhizobium sp. RCAM05350]|nr:hypothetical protein LP421_30005 [Rhizobium sp. RCAM05350]
MDFETLSHDIDGVSVVVKAIGTGPAVLALHGAATLEGHEWAKGLADRFRVYLPFHPGFGRKRRGAAVCRDAGSGGAQSALDRGAGARTAAPHRPFDGRVDGGGNGCGGRRTF